MPKITALANLQDQHTFMSSKKNMDRKGVTSETH